MEALEKYFELQKEIYTYFGYEEDWVVIPLEDARIYYWKIIDGEDGSVMFADSSELLGDDEGNYYLNEIYTQRFLSKGVYRGKDYTMICVDTHTDGNKFLQVFDNNKEVIDE